MRNADSSSASWTGSSARQFFCPALASELPAALTAPAMGTCRYHGSPKGSPVPPGPVSPESSLSQLFLKLLLQVMHHRNNPKLLHLILEMDRKTLQQHGFSRLRSGGESCNGLTCAAVSCESVPGRIPRRVCPPAPNGDPNAYSTHIHKVYIIYLFKKKKKSSFQTWHFTA